jgi:hypothetical protein
MGCLAYHGVKCPNGCTSAHYMKALLTGQVERRMGIAIINTRSISQITIPPEEEKKP